MTRVDRYDEESHDDNSLNEKKEAIYSRVLKHQNMYDEVYMNSTLVDNINNILPNDNDEEVEIEVNEMEDVPYEKEVYEEKSYSVNDYLMKAHSQIAPDNAKRDINNSEFKEQENEIRKLIDSINEKDEQEDFFKDLKGDNEDTMIGAKLKTDEFNDSIFEALRAEKIVDDGSVLNHVLGDNTVYMLEKQEESKLDHTFEEILKSDNKMRRKKKQLPVIIFSITLFILIVVVLIVVLK